MKPILSYPVTPVEATLLLSNNEGWYNPRISQIAYCKSDDTYTEVHLANGDVITVTTTLKYYEELLQNFGFYRIHQSYLLNTIHLASITRVETGWRVLLSNNELLPIATRMKGKLIERLQKSSVDQVKPYKKKTGVMKGEKRDTAKEVKLQIINAARADETVGKSRFLIARSN